MSLGLRRQVTERANAHCEYCPQAIVVEMEIDHVIPEAVGGLTVADNLYLAWVGCNGYKLAFVNGMDPETNEQASLYNPQTDQWDEHFSWSEDRTHFVSRTAIGGATIAHLRMNRRRMIEARVLWVEVGWHPAQ